MWTALALSFVCQHLELAREVLEPEQAVEVRAVDAAGGAIAGLPVDVVLPDGSRLSLGVTGPDGVVQLRTSRVGLHELQARLPNGGPLLITGFHVVPAPRRWLYALVCVPLGLVLLFSNLRGLRRRRNGERQGVSGPRWMARNAAGSRPGPSPPVP